MDVQDRDTTDLAAGLGRAILAETAAVLVAPNGQVRHVSPAAAELLCLGVGAQPATLAELAGGATSMLGLRLHSALTSAGSGEFVVERPNDGDEWLQVRGVPLGEGMLFLLDDATERERSERELRRKQQRLLAANRSLMLAHTAARAASWEWRVGQPMRWLDLAAARALIGLPPTWAPGEVVPPWRNMLLPEDEPGVNAAIAELRSLGRCQFQFRVTGSDGQVRWLETTAAVTERNAEGAPVLSSGITVDVSERKAAEAQLTREVQERQKAEEHNVLLIKELNHRVKNMLATVQSVARQSLRGRVGRPVVNDFEDRLMALAQAYELLTREEWSGADLKEVLSRTLTPYAGPPGGSISIDGPRLWLSPNQAMAMAMATHELATNAAKYGAFSRPEGKVAVSWRVAAEDGAERLEFTWGESGGPPVRPPERRGFGSRLLEDNVARELGGATELSYSPEGLRCHISAPL